MEVVVTKKVKVGFMVEMGEWSTMDGEEEYISTVDGGGREKGWRWLWQKSGNGLGFLRGSGGCIRQDEG